MKRKPKISIEEQLRPLGGLWDIVSYGSIVLLYEAGAIYAAQQAILKNLAAQRYIPQPRRYFI